MIVPTSARAAKQRRHHEEGIEPEQDPAERRRPRAAPGLRRPAGAAGQPRHLRADLRRMRRQPSVRRRQLFRQPQQRHRQSVR